MRKFHFVQPFIASYNVVNTTTETASMLDPLEKSGFTPQRQPMDAFTPEQISGNNTVRNNGYVSGAIDLDRALEEYYKSLIN